MIYLQWTVILYSSENAWSCGPSGPRFKCASHLNVTPFSCLVGVKLKTDDWFTGSLLGLSKVSIKRNVSPLYHLTVRFWTGAMLWTSHVKLYSFISVITPSEPAPELILMVFGNAGEKVEVIRHSHDHSVLFCAEIVRLTVKYNCWVRGALCKCTIWRWVEEARGRDGPFC